MLSSLYTSTFVQSSSSGAPKTKNPAPKKDKIPHTPPRAGPPQKEARARDEAKRCTYQQPHPRVRAKGPPSDRRYPSGPALRLVALSIHGTCAANPRAPAGASSPPAIHGVWHVGNAWS